MKPQVYMIGNAHIDPVWLWRWNEGYAEVRATYRSALDRIRQFDDFVFTTACAAYYKWIEDSEPEMFAEIQQAVADGKWAIVGGWWVQPDCNIPSGESFARHSLYSQRYFREKFGAGASVGWNVDSFGHNGNLPQILKKSGISSYIYMRPGRHEKHYPFKDGEPFIWRGIDASEILAYMIHWGYGSELREQHCREIERLVPLLNQDELMFFYGVGNHGGGPTITAIENIHKLQRENTSMEVKMVSPETYFDRVREKMGERPLPVVTGDLQHHAAGCYSAYAKIKELNRRAEQRLLCAEKTAVLAGTLSGLTADPADCKAAWEKVMFNQFHDIMGGCSVADAYKDAEEGFGYALTVASELYTRALQKMTWRINTDRGVRFLSKENDARLWEIDNKGAPVVIYNPLSWEVETPVYLNYDHAFNDIRITDSADNEVVYQQVNGRHLHGITGRDNRVFTVKVPAMGWTTYWVYKQPTEDVAFENTHEHLYAMTSFMEKKAFLENDFIRIGFEQETGFVNSLLDKRSGREFLSRPARPVVCDETELDAWGHGKTYFHNDIGDFRNANITVIENGPVRARIRITSSFGNSELEQLYTLYANSTDVEVIATLYWREKHKLLKMAFPTTVQNPEAVYEIPYGTIRKTANGEEEPAQAWGAVEGDDGMGLALINNGKYAYDVEAGELRMTVVRSAIYTDHSLGGDRTFMPKLFQDQGEHEFSYLIRPYTEGYAVGRIVKRAWELNSPVETVIESYHEGSLSLEQSNVRISAENVILTVLKPAEDGYGYIARLYETVGQTVEAQISLPSLECSFSTDFAPFEIKSFRIQSGNICECDLTEETV